jgi:hypothetical protein
LLSAVIAIFLFAQTFPTYAQQPSTVGELLDKGGKWLNKDEVAKLVTGATISGLQVGRPDVKFHVIEKADGSVSGGATWPGASTLVSGTWSINELGQHCSDLTNSAGAKIQGCFYYLSLDGRFYVAKTNGRAEPLYERQFNR